MDSPEIPCTMTTIEPMRRLLPVLILQAALGGSGCDNTKGLSKADIEAVYALGDATASSPCSNLYVRCRVADGPACEVESLGVFKEPLPSPLAKSIVDRLGPEWVKPGSWESVQGQVSIGCERAGGRGGTIACEVAQRSSWAHVRLD